MSTTNIYVLRLQGGRYYVGKSDDVMNRYEQHLNGSGSAWTKKYKPISLEKTYKSVSPFEEDKVTKEYMSKYGIDKVRGGSYVETELSDFHIDALNMEIWAAKDLCTQCGRAGHFVKDCYAKTQERGRGSTNFRKSAEHPTLRCQPAKTDVSGNNIYESSDEDEWGCEYCDRTFTTAFGCGVHEKSCKEKNKKTRNVKQSSKKEGACYRCGRQGHYSPDCYARTHCKGYTLDSDCESDEDSD
jgi:predicted GIY-YIG superfamily endonuclease